MKLVQALKITTLRWLLVRYVRKEVSSKSPFGYQPYMQEIYPITSSYYTARLTRANYSIKEELFGQTMDRIEFKKNGRGRSTMFEKSALLYYHDFLFIGVYHRNSRIRR